MEIRNKTPIYMTCTLWKTEEKGGGHIHKLVENPQFKNRSIYLSTILKVMNISVNKAVDHFI